MVYRLGCGNMSLLVLAVGLVLGRISEVTQGLRVADLACGTYKTYALYGTSSSASGSGGNYTGGGSQRGDALG